MELEELKELGFSDGEVKVYRAVLDSGISSLNKIHEKTGIERRNIYDILNKLIDKGLVSYIIERGRRTYQCTHPSKILDEIRRREKFLEGLERKLPEIMAIFRQSRPPIRAEVYRGNEAMKSLLNELLEHRESYWIGGNSTLGGKNFPQSKAVPQSMHTWFWHWMDRRAQQKHMMYDLVDHGTYLKGYEPGKTAKHEKMSYKYCELPKDLSSPMVIIIFGTKVAQVLWGDAFAFIIDSKGIRDSYMKYFNHFWKGPKLTKR